MNKKNKLKRTFLFIVAMVMAASPVLFAGCSWLDFGHADQLTPSSQTNPINPGGGSGNSGGSGDNTNPNPTDSIYDPPEENEIDGSDFNQYFQNYRITYVPGAEADRNSFYNSLADQNEKVADELVKGLFYKYGSGITAENTFDGNIEEINIENAHLVYMYKDTDNNAKYSFVKKSDEGTELSHSNAINNDNFAWKWNGDISNFISQSHKNQLQLAEYLILAGDYVINSDGTGNFVNQSTYFNSYDGSVKNEYLTKDDDNNEILNLEALSDVIAKIVHLGFNEDDQNCLSNYIFNYIIGKKLVDKDNTRFINAYYNNNNELKVIYDANSENSDIKEGKIAINNNVPAQQQKIVSFNRFLTDETYATVGQNGTKYDTATAATIQDGETTTINRNLEGVYGYALEYLQLASQLRSFNLLGYTSTAPSSNDRLISDSNLSSNVDVSKPIYNELIKKYGTKIKLVDGEYVKEFNANVWGYDASGEINSQNPIDTVQIKVGTETYALFSIRLPYFKNYFNTVHSIISNTVGQLSPAKKAELDAAWQLIRHIDYPYDSEFPNIPFVYFNDLDVDKMQLNEETDEVVMADSGYQPYQSMVVMPEKPVYVKEAILFINGPKDMEVEDESFELTIYARYYDSETQTYATWLDENGNQSQFYKISTETVPINAERGDLEVEVDIDLRTIISSAQIAGTERGSYLLDAFSEDNERVSQQTLISKENYGYWFNQVSTPDGATVVCFDGKATNSPSYVELVFYNPSGYSFVFDFTPDTSYSAE